MFQFLSLPRFKQHLRDKRKYQDKFSEKYCSVDQLLRPEAMQFEYHFVTQNEIKLRSTLCFGATCNDVYNLLGRPWVRYSNPYLNGHQVLLYKYMIKNCKVKCEIHFFQDKFIMGKYISDSISNNRLALKQYLLGKYCKFPLDYSSFKITDTSNNIALVNDSVQIEFIYLWRIASILLPNYINN